MTSPSHSRHGDIEKQASQAPKAGLVPSWAYVMYENTRAHMSFLLGQWNWDWNWN